MPMDIKPDPYTKLRLVVSNMKSMCLINGVA